jgi:protoporphyrin/coproporphyrin ferrochelatase
MPDSGSNNFGALLLNMGGPESLEQIQPYLYELFSDPEIIQLPLGRLYQKWFAAVISKRRATAVRERYAAIGGKSPVNAETKKQAEGLARILAAPVGFAMRYNAPRISQVLDDLSRSGVKKIIAIPLFPQYSRATSGSAISDFKAQVGSEIQYAIVENHWEHPGFINALAELLGRALGGLAPNLKTHILFTAHSIPEKYTKQGDPYIGQVKKTVDAVIGRLKPEIPASLAFQSRLGPVKWHGPSLEQELERLADEGVVQLVAQPVSFVSENLETLYDLDIVFKKKCSDVGIKNFIRVPCPADSKLYLEALAGLARDALKNGKWESKRG